MKSGAQIDKSTDDDSIIPNTEFQRDFHKNDLEKISPNLLLLINSQFFFEVEILQIYKEYIKSKQLKKAIDVSLKIGADRVIETIKKLQTWINQEDDWNTNQPC